MHPSSDLLAKILIAAAIAQASNPALYSNATPPARFRGDATVSVQLADQGAIDRTCHPLYGTPPAGMKTDACEVGGRIVAPNPCSFPQSDAYARLLCHELGHANGWPATHGD